MRARTASDGDDDGDDGGAFSAKKRARKARGGESSSESEDSATETESEAGSESTEDDDDDDDDESDEEKQHGARPRRGKNAIDDAGGEHWTVRAERRRLGLDDDARKNTYAYFARLCKNFERAEDAWRTYVGRVVREQLERLAFSFGNNSVPQRAHQRALVGSLERQSAAIETEHPREARCVACRKDRACAFSMMFEGVRLPLGADCRIKMLVLARLFDHLRKGDGSDAAQNTTNRILGEIPRALSDFAESQEDRRKKRGWKNPGF